MVEVDLAGKRFRVDNGQHLLLGAYRETLALMQTVGVSPSSVFTQSSFAISYPDGWHLGATRLPAPWHLAVGIVRARAVRWSHRWALVRWVQQQRRRRWSVASDRPAVDLFANLPADVSRRLWRPLCLAALNVGLEQASAQVFLNVLRDSLGAKEFASRLLQPRTDLSALFPDAAMRWLQSKGTDVRLHCTAVRVQPMPQHDACRVLLRDGTSVEGPAVLAVPPDRAADLLDDRQPTLAAAIGMLRKLQFAPIATVYLRYAPATRLRQPFYALLDDPERHRYGQWIFDRGAMDPALDGVVSVVISGSGPHLELSRQALGQHVAAQLSAEFGLPEPLEHFTIVEKHATLIPVPNLQRPPTSLPMPGLLLAADSAHSPYPSTIEGSVRSGLQAAQALVHRAAQSKLVSPR